ncbi:MAG: hypothetical protein AAGA08_07105 [Pseudomonadota bacterium]
MPVAQSARPSVAARAAAIYEAQQPKPSRNTWASLAPFAALALILLIGLAFVPWSSVLSWGAQEQRAFQNSMATALRAIRAGDSTAVLTLCSVTAAYGFVHALGPGHGKILLGGAALVSGATMRRMAILALVSSLAQAISAIALVLIAAGVFHWATRDLVGWAETDLAQASSIAMAGIGALLVLRGLRAWPDKRGSDDRSEFEVCACGHAHGPTVSQVESMNSTKDMVAVIASIALRPCTGALFLLIIAMRMNIFPVGCLAVLAMSLGTASFNLIIAATGVTARRMAALPFDNHAIQRFSAVVHIIGGSLIALLSVALARTYM